MLVEKPAAPLLQELIAAQLLDTAGEVHPHDSHGPAISLIES
jgi:hypothetical protein